MATDSATVGKMAAGQMAGALGATERQIDARIRTTRRQVKATELAVAALTMVVGTLAYLLLFVLVDHWIVPGGVGIWLRVAFFVGLLCGLAGYLGLVVAPLFTRRVNPVYAAHAIEQQRPTLKNSLVNFLMLRGERQQVPSAVYQALGHRAAIDLDAVPLEGAIDRSRVVRLGYVLLAAVAVCCAYTLFSPKNPLRSVGRLIVPWTDMRAATRVVIDDVRPGHAEAFHDDVVDVSAVVQGLRAGEPVTIYFSTADGRSVDQPVVMKRPEGVLRHQATLPGGGAGLQQSLTYRIEAGDARVGPFSLHVNTAPSILVEEVEYDYPDYTGLATRSVERQGDLVALEGTKVTVRARANQPITSAAIDFNCDGHRDREMQFDGSAASADWVLRLAPDGAAAHESYQLRFVNPSGQENPRPIRHRIQVTADQPPTVELVEPVDEVVEVPENGAIPLVIAASDPDFALAGVWVQAERDGQNLIREALTGAEAAQAGQPQANFRGEFVLRPQDLGLRAGDEASYWAEARDNKQPTANVALSVKRRVRVVAPQHPAAGQPQQPGQQPADNNQPGAKPEERPGEEGDQSQPEQQPPGQEQQPPQDQPTEDKPHERIDPETAPGDAFNEILKHADEQQQNNPADGESNEERQPEQGQPQGDNRPNDQGQSQEQQKPEDKPQDQPPAGRGEQGDQGQGAGGQKNSGEGQGSGQDDSSEQQGNKPGESSSQPGDNQQQGTGGESSGDEASHDGAENAPSGDRTGDQQGGRQQAGERPGAGQQQPGQKPDEKKPGHQQSSDENQEGGEHGQDQLGNPNAGRDDQRGGGQQQGNKQGSGAQPNGQGQQGAGHQPGERPDGAGQQSQERRQGEGSADGRTEPGGQPNSDDKNAPRDGQQPAPDKDRPGDDEAAEPAGGQQQPAGGNKPGEGAQSGGRGDQREQKSQADPNAEPAEDASGGDPQGQHGNSGAGESSAQQNPTGETQGQNKPRDKEQDAQPADANKPPNEGASPSNSPHESDSQGGEQGDRSGGGAEGAGQSSNQPGTGGAGQNTAADEGASQAPGAGNGETSNQAGDKKPGGSASNSDGPKQRGQGQNGASQPANSGEPGSAPSQGQPGGEGGQPAQQPSGPGSQPGQGAGGNNSGQQGEGQQPEGEPNARGPGGQDGESAEGSGSEVAPPTPDAANIEYAQQATDLALEHLRDQLSKEQPDPELLDRLQWTREDMERFVKRWDELKKQAQAAGDQGQEARRELDDALRGLGLRPRATQIEGRKTAGDRLRELRQSRRSAPPPEYAEQYRAYTEGTSKRKPGE